VGVAEVENGKTFLEHGGIEGSRAKTKIYAYCPSSGKWLQLRAFLDRAIREVQPRSPLQPWLVCICARVCAITSP
jgi:hypothetical protein